MRFSCISTIIVAVFLNIIQVTHEQIIAADLSLKSRINDQKLLVFNGDPLSASENAQCRSVGLIADGIVLARAQSSRGELGGFTLQSILAAESTSNPRSQTKLQLVVHA